MVFSCSEYPIEAGGNSGRFEPADFDPEFDQGGPDINYPFSDGSFEEYSDDDQQVWTRQFTGIDDSITVFGLLDSLRV